MEKAISGVEKFAGVERRFQFKGHHDGVDFYDDYAHHPTEIQSVLEAAREKFPQRRLCVLFQPHRYSRTQSCWDEFLSCFQNADKVYIMDIYKAGEKPIEGIHSSVLCENIETQAVTYVGGMAPKDIVELIQGELGKEDVMFTLGAGDVWKIGEKLYQ